MALVVKDRVQETTTTAGTGTITLAGAVTGFQSFSVIGNGNTTYYAIVGGSQWEVGLGTYTSSGTTLSRDTILESSTGGTAVDFSAGIKNVFCTYPAEKSLYLDASNNAIGLGTVAATTTLTNATGLPLSTGVTGTLGATNGGTAQSTYNTGDIIYASGTNTLAKLAIGTSGQALKVSSGGIPEWAAAGGSSSLTITDFTATASQTSFTVSYTVGLLEGVYRNGVKLGLADYTATNGTSVVLGTGATAGDLIQVVAFSAVSLANVVSSISFGSTGLTPSTATNGAVSVAGTLAVANGGTGASTLTANNVILGNGTSAVQFVAPGTNGNVLTSNGTTWTSAAASSGGLGGMTVYTSNATFTIPSGKTVVKVTVVGGGGGGGYGSYCGTGGGGGATAIKYLTGLTPGNTLTVTVGAAGTASGGSGGTSSVASGTQTITTISSTGGTGGTGISASSTFVSGPAGGSASNGDINISGGAGGTASVYGGCSGYEYTFFGGGGSSALYGLGSNSFQYIYGGANSSPTTVGYGSGGFSGGSVGAGVTARAGAGGIVIFEY